MARRPLVVLSQRPELVRQIASWELPDTDLRVFRSPSGALASLAARPATLFMLDTHGFGRPRQIVRQFYALPGDADLLALGGDDLLAGLEPERTAGTRQIVPPDVAPDELLSIVRRVLQYRDVRERSGIVGRSRAVAEMISLIAHAAPLDVTVLIQGESGTGKELVARAIHAHSPRSKGPFVSLNCGAVSEGVLESELFGHVRGAFTGAIAAHEGVFRRADKGTLFLDEVAEMPLGMQTRFLRALETGEFTPVGGRDLQRSEIRLVAATNRDLAAEVDAGRFRQDLYYRLRVVVIPTPPLRQRRQDIPALSQAFLMQENRRLNLAVRGIARPAQQLLEAYAWPGNIRELRNVISAAVVLKQTGLIEAEDLPDEIRSGRPSAGGATLPMPIAQDRDSLQRQLLTTTLLELREDIKEIKAYLARRLGDRAERAIPYSGDPVVDTFSGEAGYSPVNGQEVGDLQAAERTLIEAALRATGGRRKQAAARLGISERTLYRKIKRYGL